MRAPRFFSRQLAVKLGVFSAASMLKAFTDDPATLTGMAALAFPVINKVADWVASLSGNMAASGADADAAAKEAWDNLLHNEHIAAAIGKALKKRVSEVAKTWPPPAHAALARIEQDVAAHWAAVAKEDAAYLHPLADDNITGALSVWFQSKAASPLSAQDWQTFFVTMLTDEERDDPVAIYLANKLGEIVAAHAMHDLVEVLKDDFATGGQAYAAVSLRFFADLTTGVAHIQKAVDQCLEEHGKTRQDLYQWGTYLAHQADANTERIIREIRHTRGSGTSTTTPPFQLPTAASRYFGRAALITDLEGRLRKQKRTEVWGGPGMGKTALAAEAMSRIVGDDPAALAGSPFPHGVVFLDLYRSKELDAAWNALANAFDDSLPTDMKAADRAAKACAHRRALIILEGAEELGSRLSKFITVLAQESTLLVLTREETQTAAGRRLRLDDLLEDTDALALLRHLAGTTVPESILTAVQARLGGHPLALTWAGSQLGDATQPPANFLRDLVAEPFTKLTEPGGDRDHTLRWMFDRSVRLLADSTRTVLAAIARLSEPFEESWAFVAGGAEGDLQRLVQLGFLRVNTEPPGWQFAHALAAQYARDISLPEGLLENLGRHALAGITAADARCHAEGTAPLGLALAHAIALLGHDTASHTLGFVANALIYDNRSIDPVGIRRGRLDFARSAVGAVRNWQEKAPAEEKVTLGWQRESSVVFERLGNLAVAQGDLAGALRSFSESKTIRERLAASDPANAEWQRDLAVSLEKLRDLAVKQGDLAGALRCYTEYKTITERLAASDPANAAWQFDLAQSHCWVGMVEQQSGDLGKAKVSFTHYKDTMERLAASDPANAAWQRDLSVSLAKLGDLAVAQGDLAGALRSFSESKTIRERLAASDPANAERQRDLSVSLEKLGDLAVEQGVLAGALRSYTESKTIFERLAASDPANAAWQRDLWVIYWRMADVCEKSDQPTEGKGWWQKAYETLAGMKQRGLHVSPQDEKDLEWLRAMVGGAK